MNPPGIAVVNLSQRLTMADALRMVDAVEQQFCDDYAPAWGVVPRAPNLYARVEDVPAGMPLIAMVDEGQAPDAAGFHTQDLEGRVSGVVVVGGLLDAGWSLFDGAQSISCVLSHECLEADQDPWCTYWVDMPTGGQDAFELCDRVQGSSYKKGDVSVSNFLLPQAFDDTPPDGSRFDFLGELHTPFGVAPGGYASQRDPQGNPVQVGLRPIEKGATPLGRTFKRLEPRAA